MILVLPHLQSDVGRMLGWNKESVKDYAALKKIDKVAWDIIGATFEGTAPTGENDAAPTKGATAPLFTEGLLRSILKLTPEQQKELVTEFVANPNFSKGKFKALAENYQARNQMKALQTYSFTVSRLYSFLIAVSR